jgi:hypothetical protein
MLPASRVFNFCLLHSPFHPRFPPNVTTLSYRTLPFAHKVTLENAIQYGNSPPNDATRLSRGAVGSSQIPEHRSQNTESRSQKSECEMQNEGHGMANSKPEN